MSSSSSKSNAPTLAEMRALANLIVSQFNLPTEYVIDTWDADAAVRVRISLRHVDLDLRRSLIEIGADGVRVWATANACKILARSVRTNAVKLIDAIKPYVESAQRELAREALRRAAEANMEAIYDKLRSVRGIAADDETRDVPLSWMRGSDKATSLIVRVPNGVLADSTNRSTLTRILHDLLEVIEPTETYVDVENDEAV